MAQTPFVQIQFMNQKTGRYSGACYTYIADVPLCEGDIVNVPTKYGDMEAKVVRVDVPEREAAAVPGELRHITEPAIPSGGIFDGFY